MRIFYLKLKIFDLNFISYLNLKYFRFPKGLTSSKTFTSSKHFTSWNKAHVNALQGKISDI